MKRTATLLSSFVFFALLASVVTTAQAQIQQVTPDIRVVEPVAFDVSPALRSIEPSDVPLVQRDSYEIPNQVLPERFVQGRSLGLNRAVVQLQEGRLGTNTPLQNFDGLGNTDNADIIGFRVAPPDPVIEVGDEYVVEMINLVFTVYNKDGTMAMEPLPNNALWDGFGGLCETNNNGDPIVLYDQAADRWVLSQFALDGANSMECVAVSVTDDPTGEYYRYAFPMGGFNDYPKLGVGTDAYYYTHNEFGFGFEGAVAGAFERDAMLAGDPDAALVLFGPDPSRASLLPADIDGPLPPSDSPHVFAELVQDAIRLYQMDVDFNNIENSTFTQIVTLDVVPFDTELCTAFRGECIPQPNGQDLESLAGRLMHRLQFRDMGGYNAMVVSHTVDADGTGRAGVRWYEFRNDGTGWTIYQQGTYAPNDGLHRWMPSIAMNAAGTITIGYSVSSGSLTPEIRYTARPPGAPLGEMVFEETTIFESETSQGGTGRWGDYTAMVTDPTSGAFWYVNQYPSTANSTFNWDTRIASFAFDVDDSIPPGTIADLSATLVGSSTNVELTFTAVADDAGDPASGPVSFYGARYSTSGPIEDSLDFVNATPIAGEPAPAAPGAQQSFVVEGLDFETQYWFAVRAVDDAFNTSLSNSPSATTGAAPILAYAPDTLQTTLETNEQETLTLTLTNEGPANSSLDFTFPAFAAQNLLERTPDSQENNVSRPVGSTDYAKGAGDPFAGAGYPVPLGAGGPGPFGYTWIDSDEPGGPTFDWEDISGVGTALSLGDEETATVTLPFAFEFYGSQYSEININDNGYLSFISTESDFTNNPIPDTDAPNALVAAFWDDLNPGAGGTIYYYHDANDGRFIVQFTDVPHFFNSGSNTFQVILNEDGTIRYQYLDMTLEQSATVGIENETGEIGLQVAFDTDYVHDSLAVVIAAIPEFIADVVPASGLVPGGSSQDVGVTFTSEDTEPGFYERALTLLTNAPEAPVTNIPAILTVQAGPPDIAVAPMSLDYGEVIAGAQKTLSFTIYNNGAGPLQVNDINTSNPIFQPSVTGDVVIPFSDSLVVPVIFQPTDVGVETATLTIESDDPDEPSVTVEASGEGVPAPVLAVDPDSLSQTLEVGATATQTLTVSNNGGSTLDVALSVDYSGGNRPVTVDDIAPIYSRGTFTTSMYAAPEGYKSAGAPAGVPMLDPTGVIGYGANATGGTTSEFVSFDLGTPGDVNVIAPGPSGGFNGAGAVGPDPEKVYHIVGTVLWQQDVSTGSLTELGDLSPASGQAFAGMTYDPATGNFYGLTTDINSSYLYEIDVEAAAATEIGQVTGVPAGIALAAGPDGQLYTYGIVNDVLYSIDKITGGATEIGPIGFDANFGQGMEYDVETGIMYMAAFNAGTFQPELRTVNLATGGTELIGVLDADQIAWNGTPSAVSGYIQLAVTDTTVAPGASIDVGVTFDAEGLDPGSYAADIVLNSNDPDQLTTNVPTTLEVIFGEPDIAVEPQALDFGEVFAGGTKTLPVTIFNDGNGPLEVTNVTAEGAAFTAVFDSTFTVPLGDSAQVQVTFQPDAVQTYTSTLTIETNDPDEASVTVALSGEGVPPPAIAVDPDALQESVRLGLTSTDTLALINAGGSPLNFMVSFNAGGAPVVNTIESVDPIYPRGTFETSMYAAPEGYESAGAPAGVPMLAPSDVLSYGANATGGTTSEFISFDLGAPIDVNVLADGPGGAFNGAGVASPNGNVVYHIVGTVLWKQDISTGDLTQVGNLSPASGQDFAGMTYDPASSTYYGLTTDVFSTYLYEINVETATATEIGQVTNVPAGIALAAGPDGQLYTYDITTDVLYSIDKETAAATQIGPIGFDANFGQGMEYDVETGAMYMAAFNAGTFQPELRTVNLETGNTSLVGVFDGASQITWNGAPSISTGDFGYISVAPFEGTVAPGDTLSLTVTYDASELDLGTYEGDLLIASNDPETPNLEVPTTLNVIAAPYPFDLSPEEITLTLDLTQGDTTAVRDFTIENTTDEEQFFLIESQSVAGDAPVFMNFLSSDARMEYQAKMERLAAGMYPNAPAPETSMKPAPGSPSAQAQVERSLNRLLAPIGVTARSTSVFGDFQGQFVQFDLGEPQNLTPFGTSPTAFAGDYDPGETDQFYVIEYPSNTFYSVDVETGGTTQIGTAEPLSGELWSELAGDPTDGTLYGSAGSASASHLYTIDPETGEATLQAEITNAETDASIPFVIGIAIDGAGQMWGYEIGNDTWLKIDKATGEATVVGPIGFDANFAQGLDYDLDTGTMYMAAYNGTLSEGQLRTVNLETGSTTLIGPLGSGDELGYLALPSGGFLFIDTDLISGTLEPFGEVTLDATINAAGLFAGTYEAEIVVISNEPGMPSEAIPVTLTVIDDPDATLQPLALDFGEVFVGGDTTRTISVVNAGGADLEVTDIQVTPSVFTIPDSAATSFTLQPGQARTFAVTFAPNAVQTYTGSFTVVSNDPGGNVSATLMGEGIPAPALAVSPESFDLTAFPGEEFEKTLEITNTGGSSLTYAISGELVDFSTSPNAPDPSITFEDVILEENFNDGIPEVWTVTEVYPGEVRWGLNSEFSDDNYTGGSGTAAMADSDEFNGFAYDTKLITPVLTASVDNYTLAFKGNYQEFSGDTLDVDITTDGGATWTTIVTYTDGNELGGLFGPGELVTLNLAPHIEPGDQFQIRWRYYNNEEGAWDWYVQIDDVVISRELQFLTINPAADTVAAGATQDVTLSFNTTGLAEGLYEVDLNITSNDPTQDTTVVPVDLQIIESLTVEAGRDTTVVPGEQFTIPIIARNSLDGLGVQTYEFTLTFAGMLLEPVGVETEGTLSEGVILTVNTEVDGQISVAAIDTTGSAPVLFTLEGQGTLLNVVFEAQATGATDLVFTDFLFNEGDPPVSTEPGYVEVSPLYGDISLNGAVTAADATLALQYSVGAIDLGPAALTAGDVTGNDAVSAFDGFLILQYVAGEIDCFPVEQGCSAPAGAPAIAAAKTAEGSSPAATQPAATLAWGKFSASDGPAQGGALRIGGAAKAGKFLEVPLVIEDVSSPVHAVELTVELPASKVSLASVETDALPEGWLAEYRVDGQGVLRIALAGRTPLEAGKLATLKLRWTKASEIALEQFQRRELALAGKARVNEAAFGQLERVALEAIPERFAVSGNFPNPFTQSTRLAINLPEDATVTLTVYDVLGRKVMSVRKEMEAGTGRMLRIDGARLSSGAYFYRVRAEIEGEVRTDSGRMMVVR